MKGLVIIYTLAVVVITQGAPTQLNGTIQDDCSGNDTTIRTFPNSNNCSKYYQCVNGNKTEMDCPPGQEFNPSLKICDDPKYANCKVNGSTTLTAATLSSIGENVTGNSNDTTENPKITPDLKYNQTKNVTQREFHIIRYHPKVPLKQVPVDANNTSTSNTTSNTNSTSLNGSGNNSTLNLTGTTTQSNVHVPPGNVGNSNGTSTAKTPILEKVNVSSDKDIIITDDNKESSENADGNDNEKEDTDGQNDNVQHTYRGRNKDD